MSEKECNAHLLLMIHTLSHTKRLFFHMFCIALLKLFYLPVTDNKEPTSPEKRKVSLDICNAIV